MLNLDKVDGMQVLEAEISGPGEANRLFILTGTAVFSFVVNRSSEWRSEELVVSSTRVPGWPHLEPEQFKDASATASLASISSKNGAGFAVDSAQAFSPTVDLHEYGLRARVAVRASDQARLYRVSFQLNVLARV